MGGEGREIRFGLGVNEDVGEGEITNVQSKSKRGGRIMELNEYLIFKFEFVL